MKGRLFHTFIHELDEAIFPSNIYCILCGSLIDRTRSYSLCDECIGKFHWITGRTCEKCGKAMPDTSMGDLCYDCMQQDHFFTKGFSCLTYGLHERELMMDLKYAGKGYLARIFGDVMFDRLEMEIREGTFARNRIDLIVPVPVSRGRMRKRGYNQSEIMGRQLAYRWREHAREKDCHAPAFCRNLLYRSKETRMLRSLNPAERRMALKDAFAVKKTDLPLIQGKTVLLIDDIYTTGATADACGEVLIAGGAKEIYLLTLASGGNRRPGQ